MAIITNQVNATSLTNKQEDIVDAIYNADNRNTPFVNAIGTGMAHNVVHSWNTEEYADNDFSPSVYGYQPSQATAPTSGSLETNYISEVTEEPVVTDAAEATKGYGLKGGRMAHEIRNKTVELRAQVEKGALGNQDPNAGNGTTQATVMRGLPSWAKTTAFINAGQGGGNGSTTAGRTDAANENMREFTEQQLVSLLSEMESEVKEPDTIVINPRQAQSMVGFSGKAAVFKDANGEKGDFIDFYLSPTGNKLKVLPTRHCRTRDVHVIRSDMHKIVYLEKSGVKVMDLGRTGTATRKQLSVKFTLEVLAPKGNGGIFDVTYPNQTFS